MPNRDNEQANAWIRVLYVKNRDKNNEKQRLLYRHSRLPMDIYSLIYLAEPVEIASLPSPMKNPLNNQLNDAHQYFH